MNNLVQGAEISSASLHEKLPKYLCLYALPYAIPVYSVWAYMYMNMYELIGSREATFLSLVVVFSIHLLLVLSCEWSVEAKAFLTSKKSNISDANVIKVIPTENAGQSAMCEIQRKDEVYFLYRHQKYVLNKEKKQFQLIQYPSENNIGFYKDQLGLSSLEAENEQQRYGLNKFEMPSPTFWKLFREHAVAPFFVFQIFCVGLWALDDYWYFSLFTVFMLVVFESTIVAQRLRTLKEFRTMSIKEYSIFVFRDKEWKQTTTTELVPKDIVSLCRQKEEQVPADIVLLYGSAIANEAMLSGESTPMLKECLKENSEMVQESDICHGGTKILQVVSGNSNQIPTPPDKGCIGYVVRTGFGTTQGQLVRMMMYWSDRVSANNMESFLFILFLMVFAIMAAAYVYIHGQEHNQNKGKLILHCIMIVTNVIPPELPMELSLAVNSSLLALSKLAIFCTEPFRIPFAGKLDILCFDKTGTITAEDLVVEGIAGLDGTCDLIAPMECPEETIMILGTAHSLVKVDGEVVGDPMEKAALESANFEIIETDHLRYKTEIKVIRKFQFSSVLKRMSTVSKLKNGDVFISVKGAPEVIQSMLLKVPNDYEKIYKTLAKKGARVLSLGYKKSTLSMERNSVESELLFGGFLVFSSPLKKDSSRAIRELRESLHRCVMITGDNALTACHVAKQVKISTKPCLILEKEWKTIDDEFVAEFDPESIKDLLKTWDLCATGTAIERIQDLEAIVPYIYIWARVSPLQKEIILKSLKKLGFNTLMCGDGTNDVGALKQAHVGVALLDCTVEQLEEITMYNRLKSMQNMFEKQCALHQRYGSAPPLKPSFLITLEKQWENRKIQKMKDINIPQDEEVPTLRFGDASVSAPFTSKVGTLKSICEIVKQGRCTQVTTLQMYRILALNSLVSAYSMSVLFLDGIKWGDWQLTIQGMVMAICFFCITRSKPLDKLAATRPQTKLFTLSTFLSLILQFMVHCAALYSTSSLAKSHLNEKLTVDFESDAKFTPNILNSGIFLLSMSMQVSTFVINYIGHPFRESISENKILYRGLAVATLISFIGASETFLEFNLWLQLVKFPMGFSFQLLSIMSLDFLCCFLIESFCRTFSNNEPRAELLLK